mgnify:FL=1
MITDFCVICGEKDKDELHVHHIIPRNAPYNLRPKSGDIDDPTNLLTLCNLHHGWIHGCKPNRFNNFKALQMEGIRKAKAAGKFTGRPPTVDKQAIIDALNDGNSIRKTAILCGVSNSTVQRVKRTI